jgi:UDPglucose--hexose-1-phosphate uridylyltransferase
MSPSDSKEGRSWIERYPHRRFNPLLREWVLVAPHRTERPWQGRVEEVHDPADLTYDPACYLCPGNSRAGGVRNPKYESTFVFDNDFAALLPDTQESTLEVAALLQARSERGICRVVCFSPRHDLTIPRMNDAELRSTTGVLAEQYRDLESQPWIRYVQMFENRGKLMGASNPHPHCQIWASESVPNVPEQEGAAFTAYQNEGHKCLLCDYLQIELEQRERIICENEGFVTLVPYWAIWPFETMVLARRHASAFAELSGQELALLGDILRRTTIRYDNLFHTAFPYSMGFHQRPTDGKQHAGWHLHAHYYPPLLRSATVQKFMVGYEQLAMPQRDLTPENAAARLRELPEMHYLDRR